MQRKWLVAQENTPKMSDGTKYAVGRASGEARALVNGQGAEKSDPMISWRRKKKSPFIKPDIFRRSCMVDGSMYIQYVEACCLERKSGPFSRKRCKRSAR